MRQAMVEVIGSIIRELSDMPEGDDAPNKAQHLKQINGLYDLLIERLLDISSYVRARVMVVLAKLCDGNSNAKFPQQRLAMTRAAVEALEDKTSSVRKGAITLLERLILTHPYGMYGGPLSEREWKERYQEVNDLLAKMEGAVGKAVERQEEEEASQAGEGDEEEEEEQQQGEDDENEEGERKKKRKS